MEVPITAGLNKGDEFEIDLDNPPAVPTRPDPTTTKQAAAKRTANRNQDSGGGSGGGGGKAGRCELCRCSVKLAVANAKERGPEVVSAFPTGLRESYCCNCYDKLVDDIKEKKKSQLARERKNAEDGEATKTGKKEPVGTSLGEIAEEELPTLSEHLAAHGAGSYR